MAIYNDNNAPMFLDPQQMHIIITSNRALMLRVLLVSKTKLYFVPDAQTARFISAVDRLDNIWSIRAKRPRKALSILGEFG